MLERRDMWIAMVKEANERHERDLAFINDLIKVIEDKTDLKWWEEVERLHESTN